MMLLWLSSQQHMGVLDGWLTTYSVFRAVKKVLTAGFWNRSKGLHHLRPLIAQRRGVGHEAVDE
jgi:hypothetical protein